jgi:hypothetical protein
VRESESESESREWVEGHQVLSSYLFGAVADWGPLYWSRQAAVHLHGCLCICLVVKEDR